MFYNTVLALAFVTLMAACSTAAPPTSRRLLLDTSVADAAGTAVIVDVCLNYSPLGSNDYFVINNAKQGAEALMPTITQYLDASNVRTPTKLIPFVCGALHDAANEPKRVAEAIDGDVTQRRQPLWVAPEISSDMEYLQALQTVSTYLFQRGLEKASVTEPPNSVPPESPAPDDVRKAADVIVRKSGRSSLVYVGVMGHSLSSAKAATLGVVRVAAGVASIAVGPAFTVGGATYGVMVIPGGPIDKRQMVAALFDLQQARLVRSNVIHSGGDPIKTEVMANRDAIQLLLRDLVFSDVPN